MDKVIEKFEDLIRRIFGPATALFPLLFAAHWLECVIVNTDACSMRHANLVEWLFSLQASDPRMIIGGLLLLFGTGYVMAMLHCFLFDHRLHRSFDSLRNNILTTKGYSYTLADLRKHAVAKLHSLGYGAPRNWLPVDAGDFLLYEIIGGIDKGNTRQAVDSAKAYGIVCISAMFATISLAPCLGPTALLPIILTVLGWWCLGNMLVKAQYRWRSVRHYVNILMWPKGKIENILADYKEESCKDDKSKAEAGKS